MIKHWHELEAEGGTGMHSVLYPAPSFDSILQLGFTGAFSSLYFHPQPEKYK